MADNNQYVGQNQYVNQKLKPITSYKMSEIANIFHFSTDTPEVILRTDQKGHLIIKNSDLIRIFVNKNMQIGALHLSGYRFITTRPIKYSSYIYEDEILEIKNLSLEIREINLGTNIDKLYLYQSYPNLKLSSLGVMLKPESLYGNNVTSPMTNITEYGGTNYSPNYTAGANKYTFYGRSGKYSVFNKGFQYNYSILEEKNGKDRKYGGFAQEGDIIGGNLKEHEDNQTHHIYISKTTDGTILHYDNTTTLLSPTSEVLCFIVESFYNPEDIILQYNKSSIQDNTLPQQGNYDGNKKYKCYGGIDRDNFILCNGMIYTYGDADYLEGYIIPIQYTYKTYALKQNINVNFYVDQFHLYNDQHPLLNGNEVGEDVSDHYKSLGRTVPYSTPVANFKAQTGSSAAGVGRGYGNSYIMSGNADYYNALAASIGIKLTGSYPMLNIREGQNDFKTLVPDNSFTIPNFQKREEKTDELLGEKTLSISPGVIPSGISMTKEGLQDSNIKSGHTKYSGQVALSNGNAVGRGGVQKNTNQTFFQYDNDLDGNNFNKNMSFFIVVRKNAYNDNEAFGMLQENLVWPPIPYINGHGEPGHSGGNGGVKNPNKFDVDLYIDNNFIEKLPINGSYSGYSSSTTFAAYFIRSGTTKKSDIVQITLPY